LKVFWKSCSAHSQGLWACSIHLKTTFIWLVYPRLQNLVEYRSPQQIRQIGLDGELEGGDLLLGFRLPLKTLFR
jgi:hypothetical protein